jgi:hypothetical protein
VFPGALALVLRATVNLLSVRLNNSTLEIGRSANAPEDDRGRPPTADSFPLDDAVSAARRRKTPRGRASRQYAQYGFPAPAAAAPVVPALTYCQRYSGLPPTQ